ncbi:MAG: S-layer family protein, partial [Neisseriaceae bacterium]|nr:S-layer family protein [Neisseriaceae bacterium]
MNSNGLTQIKAKGEIKNTGKIYGDHTAVEASKITNKENTAVIAGRNRVDIAAKLITNQDNAVITSNGSLHFGKTLDTNGNATGLADKLINSNGAVISTKGSADWGVKETENLNPIFSSKVVEVKDSRKKNQIEYVDWYVDYGRVFKPEDISRTSDNDSKHLKNDDRKIEDYYIRRYEQWETQTETDKTNPAKISIGKDLALSGSLKNDKSQVLVGGKIYNPDGKEVKEYTHEDNNIPAAGEIYIQNIDAKGKHIIYRTGTVEFSELKHKGGLSSGHYRQPHGENPYYSENQTPITLGVVKTEQNSQNTLSGSLIDPAKLGGLFDYSSNKNPNAPLIESDPAFTDYRNWLSGQYMLDRLDPNNLHKRIGDGYYEQRLINEQVAQLTGYRYLGGYTDDEEQFKALMDNAIAVADDLQLTVGVKLTKDQVNRLTQDIVWYEKQTVSLPNGDSQEVLVPQVYLAKSHSVIASGANAPRGNLPATKNEPKQRYYTQKDGTTIRTNGEVQMQDGEIVSIKSDGDLTIVEADMTPAEQNYRYAAGSVISANTMDLTDIDHLTNTGTIQAREYLNIDGKKIDNSGSLKSNIVNANATEINIIGGDITADRAVLLNADKVQIASTTASNQDGTTVLNQIGTVQITGKADNGVIYINAKDKITANAANIENNAKNGETVLTAKDIELGTVTLSHKEKFGEISDKNHRIV